MFGNCRSREFLQAERNELLEDFDPKTNRLNEQPVIRTHRHRENLRTGFARLIQKAGLKPWPKLFGNCRSARETELLKLGCNPKAVADWMGHSLKIQAKHHLQTTEDAYVQARSLNCQISDQSAAEPRRTDVNMQSMPRVLSLAQDNTLRITPPKELQSLRRNQRTIAKTPLKANEEISLPGVHGDSLELSLEIDSAQAFEVGVKVRCSPDGKEQAAIVYDAVAHQLKIDMTQSTLRKDVAYLDSPIAMAIAEKPGATV